MVLLIDLYLIGKQNGADQSRIRLGLCLMERHT